MARIKEETVTGYPFAVVRIGDEKLGIKHVDKIGTSHGTAGMSGLGFLNH